MQNSKNVLLHIISLSTIVFAMQTAFSNTTFNKNIANNPDTLIIYDTIYVCDTIWEYVYQYDTIWVSDTIIHRNNPEKNLTYLEPIRVNYIDLSHYYYRNQQLVFNRYRHRNRKRKRVKPNWYYNFRIKHRFKHNTPKPKKQTVTNDGRLILNPTGGTFNPTIFSRGVYSFDGYAGMLTHQNYYAYNSNNENNRATKNATKTLTDYEYGVRANYNLFQYGAHLGLGIVNLHEAFNYIHTQTLVDSSEAYHVFPDTTYTVDSTQFIDLIYYFQTGTIRYNNVYDTTYFYGYDSTLYYNYDTSYVHTPKKTINNYRLLEIPLLLSYEFGYAKTSYQIKIGGVNQFHIYSSGETFSNNGQIIAIQQKNFTKYNIALYAGFGFNYDIDNQWGLSLDIYYKYPLRNISKNLPYQLRRQYYGGNFSIRYKF